MDQKQSVQHFLDLIKRSHRGKFKIYIGMIAGVGKSYRMLQEAHQLLEVGVDVKIGYIETHGRPDTEALVSGLPVIARRKLFYKGKELEEMDLQGILNTHPEIVIVDELAHTNIEGSEHAKRWQDVLQILEAGISVISAVNIQHIESLNEEVQRVSGIEIRGRIPDSVLAMADEVVNIDLTAEELIKRLKDGKIYKPEKVQVALDNFFKEENILQLRELALKEVALRVEKKVENEVSENIGVRHEKFLAVIDSGERAAPRDPQDRPAGHALQRQIRRTLRANSARKRRPHPAGQPALPDQQLQTGVGTGRRSVAGAFRPRDRKHHGRVLQTKNQYGVHRPTEIYATFAGKDGFLFPASAQQTVSTEYRPRNIILIC